MWTVGRPLLLHRPLDVERGLQLLCDEVEVWLDLEGLHRARGFELVDIDHPLTLRPKAVERALLQVRLEGATDVTPDRLPVGPLPLLLTDEHRLGVLAEQLRRGVAHRPLTDALDLDERMLLNRHLRAEVEVTVSGPIDVVLRQRDLDLTVDERLARRAARRAGGRRGVLPLVLARQAPVPATEAPRSARLQAHLPRPPLVLVVVAVTLGEDHLKLPVVALEGDLPPRQPVVQREVAEVIADQLARVDHVVPPTVLELLAPQQHLLDRGEEEVLVLAGVEQQLHQISHTGFLASRPRGSRCVCSVR